MLYGIHKREHFTTVQTLRREIDRLIDFRGSAFFKSSHRRGDRCIHQSVLERRYVALSPDGMYIVLKICQGPIDKKRMSDVFSHHKGSKIRSVCLGKACASCRNDPSNDVYERRGGGLQHDTRWKRVVGSPRFKTVHMSQILCGFMWI